MPCNAAVCVVFNQSARFAMHPRTASVRAMCNSRPPTYLGMPIKSTAHTHGRRLQAKMASRATQRRLSPASLEAMRLAMEAEQRSKPRRSALLAKGPLPAPLIVATALLRLILGEEAGLGKAQSTLGSV